MTWPFENDTSDIEKKLAKRSLHRERQRNLFAIIALVLTAFMITATFSIGFSYFETYQMQQIRLMGTTADVGITNVTENQLVEISKSNLVLDVGIQQRLGSVDTEQLQNARLGIVWIDDTEWEHHRLPTISGVVGNYPSSKNEIMLPTWVLEQMGISDPQIGMEIVLSYQIGDSYNYVSDTFLLSGYYTDYIPCLLYTSLVEGRKSMEKQKVKDEIAARFSKKNWLVKALPIAYCAIGVLLMTVVPVYADDIFATAKNAMQTVYTDVAGIATVAAVVCAAVCLFLMNFSKSGRTVDESRSWLKRIVICWAALMTLGAIVTYLEKIIPQSMFTG